jgi:hypothetical protein
VHSIAVYTVTFRTARLISTKRYNLIYCFNEEMMQRDKGMTGIKEHKKVVKMNLRRKLYTIKFQLKFPISTIRGRMAGFKSIYLVQVVNLVR